jgi:hypothetical protein
MVTATTDATKLAEMKKARKKKKKASTKKIKLGNPTMVQITLAVDKATGAVTNLDEIKAMVEDADLAGLRELTHSLRGTKPKSRKVALLRAGLVKHLDAVDKGYREAAGGKSEGVPKKLKKAAGSKKGKKKSAAKKEDDPRTSGDASHKTAEATAAKVDEAGKVYVKKYRGSQYKLVVMDEGYRVEAPTGHEHDGAFFKSATAAAKAVTGWTSVNGRKWWGLTAGARKGAPRGTSKPKTPKGVKVRDPRLPMPGEKVVREYGGKSYEMFAELDDEGKDAYRVFEVDDKDQKLVGTFSSVSAAATEIAGCQENGHRFFHLDGGIPALDPWMIIARLCVGTEPEQAIKMMGAAPPTDEAQVFANQFARLDYKGRLVEHAKKLVTEARADGFVTSTDG